MNGSPDPTPSRWIVRFAGLVRPRGTVLDVACGSGRHARWFEDRGHPVTGIDRDADALAASGAGEKIAFDLEQGSAWPLSGRRFAAIVVTNYLHRPSFPDLLAALDDGGVLLYETFAAGNERFGRPSNPDFLLAPGELLARCRDLDIVAFEDGLVGAPPYASVQRICAVRPVADAAGSRGARRHAL